MLNIKQHTYCYNLVYSNVCNGFYFQGENSETEFSTGANSKYHTVKFVK